MRDGTAFVSHLRSQRQSAQASLILDEPTLWPSVRVWLRHGDVNEHFATYWVWDPSLEFSWWLDETGRVVRSLATDVAEVNHWMRATPEAQSEITYHDFIDIGL